VKPDFRTPFLPHFPQKWQRCTWLQTCTALLSRLQNGPCYPFRMSRSAQWVQCGVRWLSARFGTRGKSLTENAASQVRLEYWA